MKDACCIYRSPDRNSDRGEEDDGGKITTAIDEAYHIGDTLIFLREYAPENVAFERPKEFIGAELEIAGSELTNPQAAEVFSRVLGKRVKFQKLPMPVVRLVLGKEFYQMFRWFNAAGFKADIPELRRRYPEVHLQTLEEWLRNEGWHKRARHVRPPKG